MKIIDAHIHFSDIKSFHEVSKKSKVNYSLEGFLDEFEDVIAVGMGLTEKVDVFPDDHAVNPMTLDLDQNPKNLYTSLGFNPNNKTNLEEFEKQIHKNVVGLKIYAGYYHYHVHDKVYQPILDLARKYDLPITIHSGDTFSEKGLLKFAHPLEIDELAVKNPDINFIIAHFGDPWIMTAAEVASKNKNVYVDLSGLIVGDFHQVERFRNEDFVSHIRRGLVYLDNYKKVLYGSDWPLVDTRSYIKFIKELIPYEYQEDVFYNNAKKLFKL